MSTRTYYRGPDAVVTDELFVWRGEPTKGFAIRDLRNVGRTRGDVDRLRPSRSLIAAGTIIVAAAAWFTRDSSVSYVFGAMGVGILTALTIASRVLRTTRHELRATCGNREVVIYTTLDERVFNQVTRALRRSMEDARSSAPGHGLTAA